MNVTQTKEKPWWNYLENLRFLTIYLQDRDGEDSLDIPELLEKPWKWENEWYEYQTSIHVDDDLDAFDRRDK